MDPNKPLGFSEENGRKSSQSFSLCLFHKTSPRFDLGLDMARSDVMRNREGVKVVRVMRSMGLKMQTLVSWAEHFCDFSMWSETFG